MLQLNGVQMVYPGGLVALEGVTLEIPRGVFGLLGPNGAGKSTLMKILAGLLARTGGTVRLDGSDMTAAGVTIGYLPQSFGFYPNLTGEQMLLHLLRLKGIEAAGGLHHAAMALLAHVNLTAAARTRIRTWSGGMRQRLGIAQAIAGNPRIVIVDEPTAGLDPEERSRFLALLASIAEERVVILSTHLVDEVAALCSHFAILRKGRLMAVTTPAEALAGLAGRIFEGPAGTAERTGMVTRRCLVAGQPHLRVHLPPDTKPPDGFRSAEPLLEDFYMLRMRDPEGAFDGTEDA